MESGILQQARELAEKIGNCTLSKEEVAAVLLKVPELASVLVKIAKEDAKQHTEMSKAELYSFNKLTEQIGIVWKDPNATPEQKKAQCDAIHQLQDKLLRQKERRENRHEEDKDESQTALKQIKDKHYDQPYHIRAVNITGIGLSYGKSQRNINGHVKETLYTPPSYSFSKNAN